LTKDNKKQFNNNFTMKKQARRQN